MKLLVDVVVVLEMPVLRPIIKRKLRRINFVFRAFLCGPFVLLLIVGAICDLVFIKASLKYWVLKKSTKNQLRLILRNNKTECLTQSHVTTNIHV